VGAVLDGIPSGAHVATGSVRRRAQLSVVRPDLHFLELRGNIHTRLGKIPDGGAIVMAAAALDILGLTDKISDYLPPATFVPSPGQGCVAIECRTDDAEMAGILAAIDDRPSRRAVEVERAFLAELGSGCSLPVGAHATNGTLTAFLAASQGTQHLIETVDLPDQHSDALARGAALARSMRDRLQ
jgi:hydroxymethylbilane synthase